MAKYLVTWTIEGDAASPEDAAHLAQYRAFVVLIKAHFAAQEAAQ